MSSGANPPPAISVTGLTRSFGDFAAVRGIHFDVAAGEVFGFLGPNGAGKSTTINMLCTLLRPSGGSARVAGFDVVRERDEVRRNIGLVFQEPTLDGQLTGEQNLRFHAELYAVPPAAAAARTRRLLELVGLWDRRGDRVQTYSGGMKRRLEIARGLLHAPRVLFLDEPTVGLDPQTRASIWAHIRRLRATEDITILMTTHYLDEAEHCDRIAIIDSGSVVALDAPEALKAGVGKDRVELDTDDADAAIVALKEVFGVHAVPRDGAVTFAVPAAERFVPRLFAELGVPIRAVRVARPSLDDVFLAYTGSTIREAESSASDWLNTAARARRMGRR